MEEKDSIFEQVLKRSFIDIVIVISLTFTFCVIIIESSELHINDTFRYICMFSFIIVILFIIPLRTYILKTKNQSFSLKDLIIFTLDGVSVIIFCIAFYIISISKNCNLHLYHWIFFLISLLASIGFGILIKIKIKKAGEKDIEKSKVSKILNWILFTIFFIVLLINSVIPTIYTISNEDYLKKIEKGEGEGISVYIVDRENQYKKHLKTKINDDELIKEIVDQIKKKRVKSLKGLEALNNWKRRTELSYYELGYFKGQKDLDYLYLIIYSDGYVTLKKHSFGAHWPEDDKKYYKIELLPETIEKINKAMEIIKKNQE